MKNGFIISAGKRFVARLPLATQLAWKRRVYARQIRHNRFLTDEPEYARLAEWIRPGDWVLDIGANVGHYTKRFSELAGAQGRVAAFEPIPETFSLLAANATCFASANVSLFNAAASDRGGVANMSIPRFVTGLTNYYEAQLDGGTDGTRVMTLRVDDLHFDHPIALVKIDAEGHEAAVLQGMQALLQSSHPRLIVETDSSEVVEWLKPFGYSAERLEGSPNMLFHYNG